MKLHIKVFASLRQKYPDINDFNPLIIDIEKCTKIIDIIKLLDFTTDEVHLILLNGIKASIDTSIEEDESILSLFPPIGGG